MSPTVAPARTSGGTFAEATNNHGRWPAYGPSGRIRTTGEVVPNFTMLTQNCDAHPILNKMHKPDPDLPPDRQDKRSVVRIGREGWERWLLRTIDEARLLVRLPEPSLIEHGPADGSCSVAFA